MSRIALDIGSKVVRAIDTSSSKDAFRFEHTLGRVIEAHKNHLGSPDVCREILEGKEFTRFADRTIHQLNKLHKKFGINALHAVATGSFQSFNEYYPGEFSCAVYARSLEKNGVPLFPLVCRENIAENPQTFYARAIESALLSARSKTSTAVNGIQANVIAVRGSGISVVRLEDKLQIASPSMPLEFRSDVFVSGSDRKHLKSFDKLVEYYRRQLVESSLKRNLGEKQTILIGKGARDLIELKLGISLGGFRGNLSRESITIKLNNIASIEKKLQPLLKHSQRKQLVRMRNTLAFIAAILSECKDHQVILSDAKFSQGLVSTIAYEESSFRESLARIGFTPFFETFGMSPPNGIYDPSRSDRDRRQELFITSVQDRLDEVQEVLDRNKIPLSAAEVFQANSYQFVSRSLKDAIVYSEQE